MSVENVSELLIILLLFLLRFIVSYSLFKSFIDIEVLLSDLRGFIIGSFFVFIFFELSMFLIVVLVFGQGFSTLNTIGLLSLPIIFHSCYLLETEYLHLSIDVILIKKYQLLSHFQEWLLSMPEYSILTYEPG